MTPNAGTARLRYGYSAEKDICLNCPLDRCIHDRPGESNSPRCPLNMRKIRRQAEAKKRKRK